ncbi:hypothetical protein Glove_134g259 [Diversispora epigaea]|uniref:Uncharacterized protein n=1 Tax=Diversispora epigaea TaxID=1348612 RepID=A0A397IX88_9GLOM|nr:hypothetical protein Glove_134g259 [Diversispora epigaea]
MVTHPIGWAIILLTFTSNIKNNARLSNKKSITIPTEVLVEKYNSTLPSRCVTVSSNYILLEEREMVIVSVSRDIITDFYDSSSSNTPDSSNSETETNSSSSDSNPQTQTDMNFKESRPSTKFKPGLALEEVKEQLLKVLKIVTRGHEWNSSLTSIKNDNTWCPYCSKYKIVSKYLGEPSKNRKPDFLKTPEYPQGLELDILYYDYGDPNNYIKQQVQDQELCEDNWIVLRYVWYYEDPYIVIPEHLQELGKLKTLNAL